MRGFSFRNGQSSRPAVDRFGWSIRPPALLGCRAQDLNDGDCQGVFAARSPIFAVAASKLAQCNLDAPTSMVRRNNNSRVAESRAKVDVGLGYRIDFGGMRVPM